MVRLCRCRELRTSKGTTMRKRLEKQGEFVATDDRGKQYRITVFKEMFDSDDSDGEKVLDTRRSSW